MNINTSAGHATNWSGDGCAIALFQHEQILSAEIISLDQAIFAGTLQELVTETEFKAEVDAMASARIGGGGTHPQGNCPIRKVLLLGLGDPAKATAENWRKAAAQAVKWANQTKCKTLSLVFPQYNQNQLATAQAMSEGIILASHKDKRFKSVQKAQDSGQDTLQQVDLLRLDPDAQAGVIQAEQICSGVILARELVSAPANIVTPEYLAITAQDIAAEYGDRFTVEILGTEECAALGMGAFLGVSQASDLPPKFIHLTYTVPNPTKKLAIIGKGVTFDSGGLNIKSGAGSGIETMKMDMAGAAAILGAAKVIGQLKPDNIEVHFITAACENMISGHAIRPGDILTASNGKTIEVNNTDAEGRLTLADALVFADKLGVDAIVDLATLTGAIIVALGDNIAGFWANNDELAEKIQAASHTAGEKFWRMPLEEAYFEKMKSIVADFKNTGSRDGSSITAALFLKQFVDKNSAWAHLDIAGPVWTEKDTAYSGAGGTGYPVRTLVNLIMNFD